MAEHTTSSSPLMSPAPRHDDAAAHETSRYTLMMLSDIVASIGHCEPLHVGLDGFPALAADPLHATQRTLSGFLSEMARGDDEAADLTSSTHAHELLHAKPAARGDAVCAVLTRLRWIATQTHFCREARSGALIALLERLLHREVCYRHDILVESLYHVGAMAHLCGHEFPWTVFLRSVEEHLGRTSLGAGELHALTAMRAGELLARRTLVDRERHVLRLDKMIAGCQEMHVELGSVWSDAMHHELESMEESRRAEWDALLTRLPGVSSKPSKRWRKRTRQLVERVGAEHVRGALLRWLPGFGKRATLDFEGCSRHDPCSSIPSDRNEDMLRGLAFASASLGGETLSAVLADMAIASYQKVPGHGPRSVRVGNACIWALGHMPQMACLGQLWRLRQKLSYASAERQIDAMIQEAAERFMISMDDLEELSVPTFGMDRQGRMEEEVGDWRFELELTREREVKTRWVRQRVNGQAQLFAMLHDEEVSATLPRQVARTALIESARLEALPREVEKMVQAQCERIESMYWQEHTWPFDLWAERYLEHPLLGVLCEDLIWHITLPCGAAHSVMPHRGGFVAVTGEQVDEQVLRAGSVRLWHPVRASEAEVFAWRAFLHDRRLTQPFKQAHREVFDVAQEQESDSGVVQLPGHVLKQHQFIALCKTRGWVARLQGSWHTPRMPERRLGVRDDAPRVQLWASTVNAPSLLTRAGAYIYVVMDQLVFVDAEGAVCDVHDVDAVVYSELWRDLELFVSVAGVGPSQVDEVLQGALVARGQHEVPALQMSGAARVRGEVLTMLCERLHWGSACEVSRDRMWVSDPGGTRLAIELHTGIVRDARGQLLDSATWQADGLSDVRLREEVTLPFEGDGILWTILRRAHLIATTSHIARMVAG